MKSHETLDQFIRKNALQITVQIFGLVMLALATYITVRLAPVAQDMAVTKQRVQAVEDQQTKMITKAEFDASFEGLKAQMSLIKEQYMQMNNKLDQLLLR